MERNHKLQKKNGVVLINQPKGDSFKQLKHKL